MKYIIPFLLLFLFVACKEDATNNGNDALDSKELIELRNELAQVKLENQRKDSVINEAISFFNTIQENLLRIDIKEDEIRIKSTNPELSPDDEEWILKEINRINELREENAKHVKTLRSQVANQSFKIKELEGMIDNLVLKIHYKDEEIKSLKRDLADLNMEYGELFDEYQEQVELALDVMKEMNTVYYAYGTLKELEENNVLSKSGGFIGIGKKTNISEDFNQDYFETLDKTKIKVLTIVGKKPEIITDHPVSSYKWEGNKLKIIHPDNFWKISNYLVIQVK